MKVTYLSTSDPDDGTKASQNRINLLKEGLAELGVEVSQESYVSKITSKSLLHKVIRKIQLFFIELKLCIVSANSDFVIVYGEVGFKYLYYVIGKLAKTVLIIERNEYSGYLIREGLSRKQINSFQKFENSIKFSQGFITCSTNLRTYYSKFANENCRFITIPLVVKLEDYKIDRTALNQITYCGYMGDNKDGISDLLYAFSILLNKKHELSLKLIGSAPRDTLLKLRGKAEKLGISNSVEFTGVLPRDELAIALNESLVLVLARPANKQAEGGMPSKVAEYLATGLPVLVTDVGEIGEYMTNNENIFMTAPNSPEKFASKLDEILKDYPNSQAVGKKGQILVENFNYSSQGKKLFSFLSQFE